MVRLDSEQVRRWVCVFITAVVIAAGLAVEAHAQGVPPALAECLVQGHAALNKGNAAEAARLFSGCLEKFPDSKLARYWLANAYYFKADTDRATAELKELVRRDPEDVASLAILGRIYSFDPAKAGLAKELLERAVALRPDLDDAYFDLARVYAAQGDAENCFKSFAAVLAGEAKYALYRVELAKVLIAAGNTKAARAQLERALAQAPNFKAARELLASLDKDGPPQAAPAAQGPPAPHVAPPSQPTPAPKAAAPAKPAAKGK